MLFLIQINEATVIAWPFIRPAINKGEIIAYCFFTVTSTFFASTFTPFLSKTIVVGFLTDSFTITVGLEGTTITSFLTSAGLPEQDIIIKTAARERKPIIFFI